MTAIVVGTGLVARTRAIESPVDVLDELAPDGFAWLEGGTGFVASGVAARVSRAAVCASQHDRRWSSISHRSIEPGREQPESS